jgi:opacity protein-like surface antigen
MKKFSIAAIAVCLIMTMTATAFAKQARTARSDMGNFEIDGSFGFASGPDSFDAGFGVNFGAGYLLTEIDPNLQARVDLSYFSFDQDFVYPGGSTNLSYTRVPFTVGARYYFPIRERLRVFGQAGLETSIDSYDYYYAGRKHSKSEVNLGITPGGGVDFAVNRNLSIFAVGRAHLITDSYFSMQFGVASHF